MKPAPFAYHRAGSLAAALERLHELGDEAKPIAGGQSLAAMMAFRLARPTALVDISRIDGLAGLRRDGDGLRIGALTTHAAVERMADEHVAAGFGALPRAARWIGHAPIRARGTFGGSVAHADPAAEWCLLAVALDARIVAASRTGEREIAARDFFHGYYTTALEPGELVVAVRFPRPWRHSALREFARRHGDFAVVAAAVAVELDDAGRCREARIALAGVDALPLRVEAAERVLAGEPPAPAALAEAARVAATEIEPGEDAHADAALRRRLAQALVADALEEALAA